MQTKLKLMAVLSLVLLPAMSAWGATSGRTASRPYRALVVIGEQWDDPGSYNIDGEGRHGGQTRISAGDFRDVITMLKVWGIPFDILRLDQQRLQINRFLNGVAKPNYSCVIWMADPDRLRGFSAHYETLRHAVEEYGMSLIALFDYVAAPELSDLVGVDYQGVSGQPVKSANAALRISREHSITDGAVGTVVQAETQSLLRVVRCSARPGTGVLGTIGKYPQLTVRDVSDETKAVWIGGGRDWFGKSAVMRRLFRQALVYSIGYGLFNDNFENALIFIMDDMGASEHAYSLRWHYPTPSKEDIVKYLVEPLAEHGFVMVQNVTPGYANPVTRMVESPWTIETFTDPFGNVQDYGSTKEGLDEGLRRGAFEIQAHRAWTHVTWDLDSPPGPWWDGPIDGEMAHGDWYQETYDQRRDRPVPSNDMLFLYKIGRDAVEKQFGVTPLAVTVRPGTSLEHDNARLAAIAGYGVDRWQYIGTDYSILFSIPEMCPEHVVCHDLDLVERADSEITSPAKNVREAATAALLAAKVVGGRRIDLRKRDWIESRKNKRWIGFNEYCAYLHSRIEVVPGNGFHIRLEYDPHYCRHFAENLSNWTLQLSERYLKKRGANISLSIDGKTERRSLSARQTITIPSGVGTRSVHLQIE
ncbi:MAG: hypothetical protein JSW66_03200 [Phycisphaerales bacterium]|nr:MAG: hypothetical protein JSW66_03200 [Phycisphaerales bacterium]